MKKKIKKNKYKSKKLIKKRNNHNARTPKRRTKRSANEL